MCLVTDLHWLPEQPDWRSRLRALADHPSPWEEAVGLANTRLNFVLTNALDEMVRRVIMSPPPDLLTKPVRLAVLGSCTLAHLHAGLRVAGLRRGIWIETYENEFGQYLQELSDQASDLHIFDPTAILFCFDAQHVSAGLTAGLDEAGSASVLLRPSSVSAKHGVWHATPFNARSCSKPSCRSIPHFWVAMSIAWLAHALRLLAASMRIYGKWLIGMVST